MWTAPLKAAQVHEWQEHTREKPQDNLSLVCRLRLGGDIKSWSHPGRGGKGLLPAERSRAPTPCTPHAVHTALSLAHKP